MRCLIFIFLVVALASPFIEITDKTPGNPRIKLLIDNSSSMELFNLNFLNDFGVNLEKQIPVETYYIGSGLESNLGENILSNVKPDDNVLLITDGNNHGGVSLGDVALQAGDFNMTFSSLNLKPDKYDVSVIIYGSSKTPAKIENTFSVLISQTNKRPVRLVIEVDGKVVFDETTDKEIVKIKQSFEVGQHRIVAKLDVNDHFDNNNIYYKTIKVIPKPKVLLYTLDGSPNLKTLFDPIYELNVVKDLELDLKPYTAIVVDDLNSDKLDKYADKLTDFVSEGNGLLVLGGTNSFDSGNYKSSRFEQLLPVFVAKSGKKEGEVNLAIVIDVSGSTSYGFGGYRKVDVEKALVLKMINDTSLVYNVGVIAFNDVAYLVAPMKRLLLHQDLDDKIKRLTFTGGTDMLQGINAALVMLKGKGGSKNIIIFSDGYTNNEEAIKSAADYASTQGIKVYTVGVGGTDEDFMKDIARRGNGIYFKPELSNQLKLIFGDTQISGDKKSFGLVVVNEDHFVTGGMILDADIYGFNQVVPKSSAKLLVTTDIGDPVVNVWRFGLGRVASIATGYRLHGAELLTKGNSLLLTRSANWVIGDPERKNPEFVDVEDGFVNDYVDVIVKSQKQPKAEIGLYKFDDNLYKGKMYVNFTGYNRVLDTIFAVNDKEEFRDVGVNKELNQLISLTGGKMFSPENIDEIVEFIKQKSTKVRLVRKSYSWIFLLAALILYLVEVCVRRLVAYRVI
ncbi:VWA domain-containing protein [Candidatus Woesearchaeota archaeon]|nr:VWA domain-containing protein [Candidatus Woesearchaeota archaeon]